MTSPSCVVACDGPQSVVNSSPFPLIVVDDQGIVQQANQPARQLFPGLRPKEPLRDCGPQWLASAHEACDTSACGPAGSGFATARASTWSPTQTAWWFTDDGEAEQARAALKREQNRTSVLVETAHQLMRSLNVDACMQTTARLAARYLADDAVVVAAAAKRRLTLTRARRDGTVSRESICADPAQVPALAEALRGFPPAPSRWIDPAAAPDWIMPEGRADLPGALIVTPLPGNRGPVGALILLRRVGREQFSDEEEVFARLFAACAGAAIGAALLYTQQAAVAKLLMNEFALPRLSHREGVEFAGSYRTGLDDHRIGGDFYDFYPPHENDPDSLVVLGDVCGKGLEAAILTGRIRTSIQALRTVESDHERMLQSLNSAMLSTHHDRFATLVLASVRRRDDRVTVRLSCAGHPAPLIVRADGSVEQAATNGTLVGVLETVATTSCTVHLAPGETCLLYSDGITEARGGPLGGEEFGTSRLAAALRECSGMPAESVVERVQMLAGEWAAEGPHDDMAVVAITAPADLSSAASPRQGRDPAAGGRSR